MNIKLDQTIIPSVPFLWYREEEILCPVIDLQFSTFGNIKDLVQTSNPNVNLPDDLPISIVKQVHVLDANIYISIHSFMFKCLDHNSFDEITTIPPSYNRIGHYKIKTISIHSFEEVPNGLKNNGQVAGIVHIHDNSFSPPGHFHFRLNNNMPETTFLCQIEGEGSMIYVLFILINELYKHKKI